MRSLITRVPSLAVLLPALLLVYYAAPRRLRNPILLAFSLGFYAYGEQEFVPLLREWKAKVAGEDAQKFVDGLDAAIVACSAIGQDDQDG